MRTKQPARKPHHRSDNSPQFGEALAAYQRELGPQHQRSLHLLHGYKVARFTRAFGRKQLNDITEERISEYALGREAAGADAETVNDELQALAWVLSWAHECGLLATIPRVAFLKEDRQPAPPLSLRERIELIFGEAGARRFASQQIDPPARPGPRPKVDTPTYRKFSSEHPYPKVSDGRLAQIMNATLTRTDITRKDVYTARHRANRQS